MAKTKKKKEVQEEPKVFGCPHCGNTEGFKELNTVLADYPFARFTEKTTPDEDTYGVAEVCWDSAERIDPDRLCPFTCSACGKEFEEAVCLSGMDVKDRGHAG